MTPREFQDAIDDGMRAVRRDEASKPPRPRREIRGKLHRFSRNWSDDFRTAACGAKIYRADRAMLSNAQFVWLPRRLQCESCLRAYWPHRYVNEYDTCPSAPLRSIGPIPPTQRSATHEMEITVETLVLAIARIGGCVYEHRCYFAHAEECDATPVDALLQGWWLLDSASHVMKTITRLATWGYHNPVASPPRSTSDGDAMWRRAIRAANRLGLPRALPIGVTERSRDFCSHCGRRSVLHVSSDDVWREIGLTLLKWNTVLDSRVRR